MTGHISSSHTRLFPLMAAMVVACVSVAGIATAQTRPPAPRGGAPAGRGDQSGPVEVQRLFDAYSVIRAQDALKLTDDQFAQFLPKLTALQETRRRNDRMHNQIVAELGRLTGPDVQVDEAQVREKLKALQDLSVRAAAELRKAYDTIDQALDVKQQARFRVFELQMERRKLELMLQARRADAARRGAPAAPVKKLDPPPPSASSK
ncbi:MAG: hypothetical protein NTV05_10140 [Acidobacteria bacterium]|nr:hypothetical protein [Acidobacteriota bacterium]